MNMTRDLAIAYTHHSSNDYDRVYSFIEDGDSFCVHISPVVNMCQLSIEDGELNMELYSADILPPMSWSNL